MDGTSGAAIERAQLNVDASARLLRGTAIRGEAVTKAIKREPTNSNNAIETNPALSFSIVVAQPLGVRWEAHAKDRDWAGRPELSIQSTPSAIGRRH